MTNRSARSTREILGEALGHLELAQRHATADLDDQLTVDAICMRLSAGIEALSRLCVFPQVRRLRLVDVEGLEPPASRV